jgi:flagellar motor switch protein FliN
MHKVLSQEEINALFSAMSSEEAGIEAQSEQAPPLLPMSRHEHCRVDTMPQDQMPNGKYDKRRNPRRRKTEIQVLFGSLEMPLEDVLKLDSGSIVKLDKSVNDPVTVIVNHRPIAKGEVVVIEGNYGVRILEVESTVDRIRSLS